MEAVLTGCERFKRFQSRTRLDDKLPFHKCTCQIPKNPLSQISQIKNNPPIAAYSQSLRQRISVSYICICELQMACTYHVF